MSLPLAVQRTSMILKFSWGNSKQNDKEVVHEEDGNIVVINTCGFIDNAKEESVNTILDNIQRKEAGEIDKVFVTGCLSERYKPDLEKEILKC